MCVYARSLCEVGVAERPERIHSPKGRSGFRILRLVRVSYDYCYYGLFDYGIMTLITTKCKYCYLGLRASGFSDPRCGQHRLSGL